MLLFIRSSLWVTSLVSSINILIRICPTITPISRAWVELNLLITFANWWQAWRYRQTRVTRAIPFYGLYPSHLCAHEHACMPFVPGWGFQGHLLRNVRSLHWRLPILIKFTKEFTSKFRLYCQLAFADDFFRKQNRIVDSHFLAIFQLSPYRQLR